MPKVFIMRKTILMLAMASVVMLFSTVSSAQAKVPACTTGIEKAAKAEIAKTANTNGANVNQPITRMDIEGYNVEILSLEEIHWVADEEFYLNGYKALLSKEVAAIFVPPNLI